MNYLELSLALRKYKIYIFTLEDVKNLLPGEKTKAIKNNLIRWLGNFRSRKKGVA